MNTTVKKDQGQAKDAASQAMDKTREAAGHAGDAVQHAASAAASAVGQKAEDATHAVAGGIQSLAGQVRDSGPSSGMLGNATRSVADTMESAGKYIDDKQLSGMMDDVTGLIKRNPLPALLLGLGIGFLVGRALSSSSRS